MTANIGAGEFEENTGGVVLFGQTLSARTLGIALGVIGIVVAGYGFATFVQPLLTTLDTLNTGIDTKNQSITTKSGEVKAKADLPKKFEAAKERTKAVMSLFPTEDSMDVLLIDLNKLVQSKNIPLKSYAPGSPSAVVADGQYRSVIMPMTLDAPYADAVDVIQSLESLQASLAVRDLKLTKAATSEEKGSKLVNPPLQVTTTFNLVAYVPLSEDEVKAAAAPPKK